MTWYLVLYDLLISIGSILSLSVLVIYIKIKSRKDKAILWRIIRVISVIMILIVITFVYAGIFGFGTDFDSFVNMRPLLGPLRTTGLSFIYYMVSYPMYLFMIARSLYLVYDVAMSPQNLKPNKQGFSAVSMSQQIKDEAERFGQGENFK